MGTFDVKLKSNQVGSSFNIRLSDAPTGGTILPYIFIEGTWKTPNNAYVQNDGSWKEVNEVSINIEGNWKTIVV